MSELKIENTIEIYAPIAEVWDALTNPEKTKIYMFGCETVSDWKVGSELLWKGFYEGKEMIFVKGQVLSVESYTKLVYSTFDPNSTMEDIQENYLEVTYELIENGGKTTLNVTQGDYSKVADGKRRYKEGLNNGKGWDPILIEIKKLVESN